jgi:precorrin-6B methylase 1
MVTPQQNKKGSLTCVGIGMTLGSHITPKARNSIEQADVVFAAVSDGIVEQWVEQMNPDVRSLQIYYQDGKSRNITYKQMQQAMLDEVRAGKRVCGAFYGHPGVFALVPHKAIEIAKAEGFKATMEPGISAEDCLFADLAIDPGKFGCQQYEASQFMFFKRVIDPSAYLILWQIGVAGDLSHGINVTTAEYRALLLEILYQYYPHDHSVILYEAATLAIKPTRKETIKLADLVDAELKDYTTLVIPPSKVMEKNQAMIERLKKLALAC